MDRKTLLRYLATFFLGGSVVFFTMGGTIDTSILTGRAVIFPDDPNLTEISTQIRKHNRDMNTRFNAVYDKLNNVGNTLGINVSEFQSEKVSSKGIVFPDDSNLTLLSKQIKQHNKGLKKRFSILNQQIDAISNELGVVTPPEDESDPTEDPDEPPVVEDNICEAGDGAKCIYISTDGQGPGTFENPAGSFGEIANNINPGDYIYFRGGTYGYENTTVFTSAIDYEEVTDCTEIDGYCRFDVRSFIPITNFDGYASNAPIFNVAAGGTAKSYPGETAIFDMGDLPTSGLLWQATENAAVLVMKSDWTIEGIEIIGGGIYISGDDTVNVNILSNHMHDFTVLGWDNIGFVTIDHGIDAGGPSNITIQGNDFHGLYDPATPGQIPGFDAEHHGAITMLSRENYEGVGGGGTGEIKVLDNRIYDVPGIFYAKNPSYGPVQVKRNHFHSSGSLGVMNFSRLDFSENLVETDGFWRVSGGLETDPALIALDGQNLSFTNNTFVNLDYLAGITAYTEGLVSENNVFYGMSGRVENAVWDTPAYLFVREQVADSYPGTAGSILHAVTSNNNCFIPENEDLLLTQRRFSAATTGHGLDAQHLGVADSQATYGLDINSTFVAPASIDSVFQDPASGNYSLVTGHICSGKGKTF